MYIPAGWWYIKGWSRAPRRAPSISIGFLAARHRRWMYPGSETRAHCLLSRGLPARGVGGGARDVRAPPPTARPMGALQPTRPPARKSQCSLLPRRRHQEEGEQRPRPTKEFTWLLLGGESWRTRHRATPFSNFFALLLLPRRAFSTLLLLRFKLVSDATRSDGNANFKR